MNGNGPIQCRKLYHEVLDRLMQRIHSGEIRPGDQLPAERELMDQYGVGRPAIREALVVLEARGMVDIRHGARARVADRPAAPTDLGEAARRLLGKTAHAVEDIKEARLVLETAIARRAAERASDGDIARLKAALEDNRRAIPERDAYLRTDIAFHRTIASISGNAVFEAASEAMLAWLARFRVDMVHVEGANLLSHDEHARIAEAIARRDPDAAERAMTEHQMRSHALYRRLSAGQDSRTTKVKTTGGRKSWPKERSRP